MVTEFEGKISNSKAQGQGPPSWKAPMTKEKKLFITKKDFLCFRRDIPGELDFDDIVATFAE